MKEKSKQEDFSCELPGMIERAMVLVDFCYNYKEEDSAIMSETFVHGLGAHFQALENDLRRLNEGLYGH